MGIFEAFEKSYSSIVKALFPSSMSEIGDIGDLNTQIGDLSTQMASRVDEMFKRASLRMSEIDKTMQRLNETMVAMNLDLAARKYKEPVCVHETVEVALRLR